MEKSNYEKYPSAWSEDEQFRKFLHEYIEDDACHADPDSNPKILVSYQTLYKLYTATLKNDIQKFDEDLCKLNESIDMIEEALTSFGGLMMELDKTNKSASLSTRIFITIMIGSLIIFIYCTYRIIL